MERNMEIKSVMMMVNCLLITACSNEGCKDPIIDDVRFADSIRYDNSDFYLYTRTTGWNDKAVYFELYAEKPTLDQCNQSEIKPIYDVVYDDYPEIRYVKQIHLQMGQPEKLNIVYTANKNEGIENVYDVKFTR